MYVSCVQSVTSHSAVIEIRIDDENLQDLAGPQPSFHFHPPIIEHRLAQVLVEFLVLEHAYDLLGYIPFQVVKQRQVALFALVDPALGKAIADGIGVSVPPLPKFPVGPTWLNTTVSTGSSTLNY